LTPPRKTDEAKTISSFALVALASIIACLNEPVPESLVVATVKIANSARHAFFILNTYLAACGNNQQALFSGACLGLSIASLKSQQHRRMSHCEFSEPQNVHLAFLPPNCHITFPVMGLELCLCDKRVDNNKYGRKNSFLTAFGF
jgi:hypothetical protein